MTWKDRLIPGFMGEAMRSVEVNGIMKEEDMELSTNPLKNNKEIMENTNLENTIDMVLDAKPPHLDFDLNLGQENKINEIMVNPTVAKVFSGKNSAELENNINAFLGSNPLIEIVSTDFGTTVGGVYYTLLYTIKTERV